MKKRKETAPVELELLRGHPAHVVGWREWVSFPQLGIPRIKAKLDTGARSSAIYATEIQKFRRGGRRMVRFKVPYQQHSHEFIVETEAELVDERRVRSSSGHTELRPVIRTYVELVGVCWPLELTLSNRGKMKFRMLLGRAALQGRFIVDAEKSYVAGRPARLKRARPLTYNGDLIGAEDRGTVKKSKPVLDPSTGRGRKAARP